MTILIIESDTSIAITTTIGTFFISTRVIICISFIIIIIIIIIMVFIVIFVNKKMSNTNELKGTKLVTSFIYNATSFVCRYKGDVVTSPESTIVTTLTKVLVYSLIIQSSNPYYSFKSPPAEYIYEKVIDKSSATDYEMPFYQYLHVQLILLQYSMG